MDEKIEKIDEQAPVPQGSGPGSGPGSGRIISIVAAVIVVVAVGVALYLHANKNSGGPGTAANTPPASTSTGVTGTTGAPTGTSVSVGTTPITASGTVTSWKTYTNDKYGFTLQYPANDTVESNVAEGAAVFASPNGENIYFAPAFTAANGELAMNGGLSTIPEHSSNSQTVNVNGYAWQKDLATGGYYLTYSLRTGGVAVGFAVLDNSQAALMQEMVNSFKFISLPYERADKVVAGLQAGNTFGAFKVASVAAGPRSPLISADNAKVTFTGPATLQGNYQITSGGTAVCITLDAASVAMLPQLDHSYNYANAVFCSNDVQFFTGNTGSATIIVGALAESLDLNGPSLEATITGAH